jgi:hypothetical protein
MKINNFDTSKIGVDIEFDGRLDWHLARMRFDENIKSIKAFGYPFYLVESDDEKPFKKLTYNQFWQESTLIQKYGYEYREYVSIMHDYGYNEHDKLEWSDYFYIIRNSMVEVELNWYDRDELFDGFLSDNYHFYVTRGYLQGDAEWVIIPDGYSTEYVDNLFWGSPVYARLSIDEEEVYIDEYLDNLYIWDTHQVIEGLKRDEYPEVVINWCEENLPDSLDYI